MSGGPVGVPVVVEGVRRQVEMGGDGGLVVGRQGDAVVVEGAFAGRDRPLKWSIAAICGDHHRTTDDVGPGEGQFLGDVRTEGGADDDRGTVAEMLDESGGVGDHVVDGESLGAFPG